MIKGALSANEDAMRPLPAAADIDDASRAIITLLQEDGRRAYADIGDALGLSEASVRQRVEHLIVRGLIQITAVTDPLQLGFARQALLGLGLHGASESVVVALTQFPEIVYLVETGGGFDLLAEVVGRSDAHLLEVTDRARHLPGVMSVHTFLYKHLHKQVYTWGAR